MKTETAMNKKNVITATVPSNLTLEKIWSRVITRRPAGCYHIRMVSASDDRTLEIMPSYEGWSSILNENQIMPGMVGSGFVYGYTLATGEITDFPVGKVEFLLSEEQGEERFNILLWEDNHHYNSLEAMEYLRDRREEARRGRFVCQEIGKLIAAMQAADMQAVGSRQIQDKLEMVMEGSATEEDFSHADHDCITVAVIKDVAIALIRFLSNEGSEVDVHHSSWVAREILRARN